MVHYCKTPITLYQINDYTPNLPHVDYRTFPHMVRMFKEICLKNTKNIGRKV